MTDRSNVVHQVPGSPFFEFPATGEQFGFTRAKDLIQALELALTQAMGQRSRMKRWEMSRQKKPSLHSSNLER